MGRVSLPVLVFAARMIAGEDARSAAGEFRAWQSESGARRSCRCARRGHEAVKGILPGKRHAQMGSRAISCPARSAVALFLGRGLLAGGRSDTR